MLMNVNWDAIARPDSFGMFPVKNSGIKLSAKGGMMEEAKNFAKITDGKNIRTTFCKSEKSLIVIDGRWNSVSLCSEIAEESIVSIRKVELSNK